MTNACAACGNEIRMPSDGIGTGSAIFNGMRICYSCADAMQVAEVLADDRKPIFAYWTRKVSGVKITTWTDGELPFTITRWTEHNDYRSGGFGDRNRYATGNARDSRGRMWAFRAAVDNGTYIKLRPIKG